MQRCLVAYSDKVTKEEALSEVVSVLKSNDGGTPILIIFFSTEENFWYYCEKIKFEFPNSTTIGCTTYKNLTSSGYGEKGFSAMAIYSGITVSSGLIFGIDMHPSNFVQHVRNALEEIKEYDNTCCLCLSTALFGKEGLILDTLQTAFDGKDIPVIGSSCGMVDPDAITYVSLNGVIYKNTSAFVFIHNLTGKIIYHRENIFKRTRHMFNATDVDCDEFRVYEYDNKPAVDAICDAAGVELDNIQDFLATHPMGRIIDGAPFITEVNKVFDDGSISFFANIYNHAKVVLMELDDIKAVWDNTTEALKSQISNPSFGIVVNCYARTRLFEKKNIIGEFINKMTLDSNKFIGVTGYGEQLNTDHMNESLVIFIFE